MFTDKSSSKTSSLTMNKALLTVLVIALVAGYFTQRSDALLRAGRDKIEKLERKETPDEEEDYKMYEAPIYYRRGETKCGLIARIPKIFI